MTRHMQPADPMPGVVSRRAALRGIGAVGIATALAAPLAGTTAQAQPASVFTVEPTAGSWTTWVLESAAQLRPSAPPDDAATAAELADLKASESHLIGADRDRIVFWNAGSPGFRWNQIAMQHIDRVRMAPGYAYRAMAMLNVAIYDAIVAAWDAKYTYNRPRPAMADASLITEITTPASPSYPSDYAATAGAAAAVLTYLFPDAAETFASLAREASDSRIAARVEFTSDAEAGLELGRSVGSLVSARAVDDRSDAGFDPATMATGDGLWVGKPLTPTLGEWQTWMIPDGTAFKPGPPPAWDSPERQAEVDEVRNYQRDAFGGAAPLFFWPENPSGRPDPDSGPFSSSQAVYHYAVEQQFLWSEELARKISEYQLESNPPRAARAYALVNIAGYDATVACWNAKFEYMTARPNQFDPTVTTVIPTPPIPDYPSGHAATTGGTAQVLSYLFPNDAHYFHSQANECAASRIWAGIHFCSACDAGLKQGHDVGDAVIAHARADGADN